MNVASVPVVDDVIEQVRYFLRRASASEWPDLPAAEARDSIEIRYERQCNGKVVRFTATVERERLP